jgi:hypothetical protein
MPPTRALVAGLVAATLLAGCGPSASPSPAGSATPSAAASASGQSVEPSTGSPVPSPSPTATPVPTQTPTPTPPPAPGDAADFWRVALGPLTAGGRIRLIAAGPSPGEIRYEPTASASMLDGHAVFVCLEGVAYDSQNLWEPVPGVWSCGAKALRQGFRELGQPLEAWSPALEPNTGILERVRVDADGTWLWDYSADSPQYGGRVTATVRLDPATGRILSAVRDDPIGRSGYTFEYGASFPPIALPGD